MVNRRMMKACTAQCRDTFVCGRRDLGVGSQKPNILQRTLKLLCICVLLLFGKGPDAGTWSSSPVVQDWANSRDKTGAGDSVDIRANDFIQLDIRIIGVESFLFFYESWRFRAFKG